MAAGAEPFRYEQVADIGHESLKPAAFQAGPGRTQPGVQMLLPGTLQFRLDHSVGFVELPPLPELPG